MPVPFVDLRLVDDAGARSAWDGSSTGEIEVRGPWIARAYYRDDDPARFDDGWLRTGDIARVDPDGWVQITDRSKDVIKSGGEWISSVELENQLMAHPAVHEAAVIAIADERWGERPLACVVLADDADVSRRRAARAPARRTSPAGGCRTSSRSSARCPRPASASSTRRRCAPRSTRGGSQDGSESADDVARDVGRGGDVARRRRRLRRPRQPVHARDHGRDGRAAAEPRRCAKGGVRLLRRHFSNPNSVRA